MNTHNTTIVEAEYAHPATEGQLIKTALGSAAWCNLSPEIQKRFETDPDTVVEYNGVMSEVYCSYIGRMIAFICKFFGSPLVPYNGKNIPIHVMVYKKDKDIFKKRTYYFPGKSPFTVKTRMHVDASGKFIEYANLSLGMVMTLHASEGNLYFRGHRYVLSIGSLHIPIPTWTTPGIVNVKHADYEPKQFRVRIEMRHPWFGITFMQDGVFKQKEG